MLPVLQDRALIGLNTMVPALASSLGASAAPIRSAAAQTVATLVASMDPSLLVQNLSHCIKQHDTRGKALLMNKLTAMVPGERERWQLCNNVAACCSCRKCHEMWLRGYAGYVG